MPHEPLTQRLFVALYPPGADAASLLALLDGLDLPEHRRSAADQVHLTLQFIGDVDRRDLEAVEESVERSAAGLGAFLLTPLLLGALPQRGPARLVAVHTDTPPTLAELHRRLAHRLARHVRARSGERFVPHMTLCRFAHTTSASTLRLAVPDARSFDVRSIALVRSVLRPEGAVHMSVRRFELG